MKGRTEKGSSLIVATQSRPYPLQKVLSKEGKPLFTGISFCNEKCQFLYSKLSPPVLGRLRTILCGISSIPHIPGKWKRKINFSCIFISANYRWPFAHFDLPLIYIFLLFSHNSGKINGHLARQPANRCKYSLFHWP